jgi:hypothetical protein
MIDYSTIECAACQCGNPDCSHVLLVAMDTDKGRFVGVGTIRGELGPIAQGAILQGGATGMIQGSTKESQLRCAERLASITKAIDALGGGEQLREGLRRQAALRDNIVGDISPKGKAV